MVFDLNLAVMSAGIGVPDVTQLQPGEQANLEMVVTVPMVLPFSQGPGQGPMTAPLGTIRFSFERDQAIELFGAALEKAKELPRKSDLTLASDLSAVTDAAEKLKRVTG